MKSKNIIIAILAVLTTAIIYSCEPKSEVSREPDIESGTILNAYDSAKAAKLGADDYGMKQYVMAFLKAGPNRSSDSTEAARLQQAHMANIKRMADEGKLVLAGPFLGNGELRGIYIFDVRTISEAEALTNTDPAIQSGSLEMELREWYGSAALMTVSDMHKTVAKIKF